MAGSRRDVRQKPRTSNASLDRSARRFGLHDAIATPASQLGTNVLDDFETGWHVLQDYRRFDSAPRLQNLLDIRRKDNSNVGPPPVCHSTSCCYQTQRANTPEDIDRLLGGKMSCPKDLKRLAICSRVSISRECSHSVSGFSQYAGYRSRTAIEVRHKPIQILFTFNESLIGISIIPDPQQDSQIACVFRLSISKHG